MKRKFARVYLFLQIAVLHVGAHDILSPRRARQSAGWSEKIPANSVEFRLMRIRWAQTH